MPDIFDELNNMFQGEGAEKWEVLKDLSNKNNIEMKTDLTPKQIKGVIQLEHIIRIAKDSGIDLAYIRIGVSKAIKIHNVSKNRLGRAEIIQGIQSENEEKNKINKIKESLGI